MQMILVNEKLSLAKRLCEQTDDFFPKFFQIYPFTNENVAGYIDFFDLKDKSLLTVGSSADQAINAISRGCKDITILDLCPFTKENFYLKSATIQTLSRNELLNLLMKKNPYMETQNEDAFKIRKYKELMKKLKEEDKDSYDFWNKLTSTTPATKIRDYLYTSDQARSYVTEQINLYLQNDDTYYETREKLSQVIPKFIIGDVTNVSLTEKYDNIILSNVASYYELPQIKNMFETLSNQLKPEGRLMLGYLFRTDENSKFNSISKEIYDIEKIKQEFEGIELKSFQGIQGIECDTSNLHDSVYVYQKKK